MKYKNNINDLKEIVRSSLSWAEVCRKLGRKQRTGNQSHIKTVCVKLEIDFSHFTGQAWNKGKTFEKKDIKLYFDNRIKINSNALRKRLISEGYKKQECEICKTNKWQGEDCPLELDHIDSNHLNNNLSNLQIICPNCHALETIKRRKKQPIKIDKRKERRSRIELRKIKDRPDITILKLDIEKLGYAASGRKYGVSDNCIRKWIKWESAGMVDNSVLETEAK